MNRGHRNFKSADKCVVLARLRADEELQPGDARGSGRISAVPRLYEWPLAAVAFSAHSRIARPLANERMQSPVGEVFSNPTSLMIQGGSGDRVLVGMGECGNQGNAHKDRPRRRHGPAHDSVDRHRWWRGRCRCAVGGKGTLSPVKPIYRAIVPCGPPTAHAPSRGIFVACIDQMWVCSQSENEFSCL